MSLSQEEKVACEKVFFAITQERIDSHRWNPKAAALLYKFLYEVKTCSRGAAWITNMPAFPITGTSLKKLARTAGKYIQDVYKEYQKIDRLEKINPRCGVMTWQMVEAIILD